MEFKQEYEPVAVDYDMFVENRAKAIKHFANDKNCVLLLQGGSEIPKYNTDTEALFRQESFFFYLFGLNEADFFAAIDPEKKESILFMPRLGESYELWCGKIKPAEFYKKKYKVDHCYYADEISKKLKERNVETVYLLHGQNTDSKCFTKPAEFEGMDSFKVDRTARLHDALVDCRVNKTEKEMKILRYVCGVNADGYPKMMKVCRPGMMEYQFEALHYQHVYAHGQCRYWSFGPICGSGCNSAILHYGHAAVPNDKRLADGEQILLDFGCDYSCYASDITRTIPVNGTFSQRLREIYEAVYTANTAVIESLKPGVNYKDMNYLALRKIGEVLLKYDFLRGTIDELMKLHIPAIFMPHGLGHLMGVDAHDVGGYAHGIERTDEPSLRCCRLGRNLEEGMVLTVEPGCYFIDAFLDKAMADKNILPHLNVEKINSYRGFGGVRIEDDILITKDGYENLTAAAPKSIEDIERVMKH